MVIGVPPASSPLEGVTDVSKNGAAPIDRLRLLLVPAEVVTVTVRVPTVAVGSITNVKLRLPALATDTD